MTTVINTPGTTERTIETDSGGWAIAVIILLLVIAGGAYAWMRYGQAPATSEQPDTNITVTLPAAVAPTPAPAK